jgi:hypothetical protein
MSITYNLRFSPRTEDTDPYIRGMNSTLLNVRGKHWLNPYLGEVMDVAKQYGLEAVSTPKMGIVYKTPSGDFVQARFDGNFAFFVRIAPYNPLSHDPAWEII